MTRSVSAIAAGIVLILALSLAPPASAAGRGGVPAAVALTSHWDFRFDHADRGLVQGWSSGGPARGWTPISVPHVFDPRPRKSSFGGTVGWYRLRFRGPTAVPGYGWGVHFDQGRRFTIAWLNGVSLGVNRDPYLPFTLPATGLRPGAVNTLVVRVDNRKAKEPREGWWNWGGLTRPVSLVPRGPLELRDRALMPDVHCTAGGDTCSAAVLFDGTVVNRSGTTQPAISVSVSMTPPSGGAPLTHAAPVRSLAPGESTRVRFRFPVADPQLWSPDAPNLYDATMTTSVGSRVVQINRQRVGLRGIEVVNGLLELNGRQLDLRGAAIQEDIAGHGPALTDADVDKIVGELKDLHANVTRAHYLLNRKLLDRFDEQGILVWSQAPIYHRDRLLATREQRDAAVATVRGTVMATRSHASVLTHSVANELSVVPDGVPGTRAFLDEALRVTRDLDPTLPVSADLLSYPGFGAQRTYGRFDLLGINSYYGWYPGKSAHSTAQLSDLGPYLDRMRELYPKQALVLTEFGAESTFSGPSKEKETYAFQSKYIRAVLDIVETRPYVGGAIYWTLREFAVKPDWDGGAARRVPRDSIHNKGLIAYGGWRKPAWTIAVDDFGATPLYREVTRAVAANVPTGSSGGGASLLLWGIVLLVLGLVGLDAWALHGILGRRRSEQPAEDGVRA